MYRDPSAANDVLKVWSMLYATEKKRKKHPLLELDDLCIWRQMADGSCGTVELSLVHGMVLRLAD